MRRSGQGRVKRCAGLFGQGVKKPMVEGCDAVVIKFRCDGSVYGHLLRRSVPGFPVSLDLFPDIPNRILPAAFFKLVDNHPKGTAKELNLKDEESLKKEVLKADLAKWPFLA